MFLALANLMVLEISKGFDTLTEYATMFPSVHGDFTNVKGSQLSWATAGAIIEDDDLSLEASGLQRKCRVMVCTAPTADMVVSNSFLKIGIP